MRSFFISEDPITTLLHVPNPFLVAKTAAISITEMFLPAFLVV
ncbi:hypothetical protein [Sporosarcina sp. SAFN-015]